MEHEITGLGWLLSSKYAGLTQKTLSQLLWGHPPVHNSCEPSPS